MFELIKVVAHSYNKLVNQKALVFSLVFKFVSFSRIYNIFIKDYIS
jgi:hypothetical protein